MLVESMERGVRPARARLRRLSGCVQSPETPSEASFLMAPSPFFKVTPDFQGLKTSWGSGLRVEFGSRWGSKACVKMSDALKADREATAETEEAWKWFKLKAFSILQ